MKSCKDCRKEITRGSKLGRCKSCSRKGDKNHSWRGGVSLEINCKTCGKVLKRGCLHTTGLCKMCFLKDPERRKRLSSYHRKMVEEGTHKFGDGTKTSLRVVIRGSTEMYSWITQVYTRDGFKCVDCGYTGKQLTADHIKPFAQIIVENDIKTLSDALLCDELWDVSNGRTLCRPCHKLTPTWGLRTAHKLSKLYAIKDPTVTS